MPAWAGASQPLPTPFPEIRYQQMSARSPFAVASTTAAAPAATPGFAAQLYVDGVARVGQTDYVAIKSRDADKPVAYFVEAGKSTTDGLKVDRVMWSDVTGKSTVEVSRDGEKAILVFDEAMVDKSAGQQPMPVQPQPIGRPGFFMAGQIPGQLRHRNPLDPLQP